MIVSTETLELRMRLFREACEQLRLKVTHQRLEIYRVVASTKEHPDAETIYNRVRERIPTVSLDTVYRNLRLLADYGLVTIVGISRERLRFDANLDSHHHFVCVKCGIIHDFHSDSFRNLHMPEEVYTYGNPHSLQVEIKGVCATCKQADNKTS